MNEIINPPCNSWKQATSFIMPDEKKKKSQVVVRGEGSCHVESSRATPDVVVSPYDQFPLMPPLCVRLLWVVEIRGDEWTTRAQKLATSQKSSMWVDICQLLVGASWRESLLRRQSGELGSFRRRTMHLILLDYQFVSFQASQYPLSFYWDVTLASCSIR